MPEINDEALSWFRSNWDPERELGEWWNLLAESGWGFPTWPTDRYGRGIDPHDAPLVNRARREVGALGPPAGIAANLAGPTLLTHGTAEQKDRFLPGIVNGEVWCQLFSEPGSGSDLASLQTRAVRDGDQWVINGQKVWTTLAHVSRWGLLVVRTDAEAVKHAGLTAFVVDMHADTVETRPLRQMTGEAEFNEVYFTDTRIPDSEILGSPGDGWRVSLTTLMNERTSIGGSIPARGSGSIGELMNVWESLPDDRKDEAALDRVMQLWIRAEVHRLTNIRANQNRRLGDPGPEGSIGKMESANLNKAIYEEMVGLMGADGMLYGSYAMDQPATTMSSDSRQKAFLRSRANSIEGGTTEVMLNILGERVLGLPGDVRVDREIPWSQVPRN